MPPRNYWLDLFTGTTWKEFLDAGGKVSGFRESRWTTVQKIRKGDYLLCYLTGVSRFIGVLEVESEPYKDTAVIWKDQTFPCRVRVEPFITLTPETAVPVYDLRDRLSCFLEASSPVAWTGHFRGSPTRWKQSDGEAVAAALRSAQSNPKIRPIDRAKLARRPRTLTAKIGPVTVPEGEELTTEKPTTTREPREHTEIQFLLLMLGSDMGFDVWVARNDRSCEFNGQRFSEIPRLKVELPLQFDEATNRTIELIDVLWLKGSSILAAFEIESTTSVYSGLLRMSDLAAMQPNLNIPLYLVAPDDRRDKVLTEINRPTFSKLEPPLSEVCRFIAFSELRKKIQEIAPYLRFLKPEFLEELSESCEIEQI
ncbi:MAG: hypothetical protein AB1898_04630 [Acidobacteriota bacterium]